MRNILGLRLHLGIFKTDLRLQEVRVSGFFFPHFGR